MRTELIPIEIQNKVESDVSILVDGGHLEKITNPVEFENSGELRKQISKTGKRIDEQRKAETQKRRDEVTEINDFFNEKIGRLKTLQKNLDGVMKTYEDEQEALRIEAQRKADAEARKERERLEAIARKQREKEEAERAAAEKAERERIAAEQAVLDAKNEEERKAAEAVARARAAEERKANAKAETAANKAMDNEAIAGTVVSRQVMSSAPKIKGRSTRTVYEGEIINVKAFISQCFKNNELHLLSIDQSAVNRVIHSERGEKERVGVRVIAKTVTATR